MESWGTYGIFRRIAATAGFSDNLLAGLVLFRRDDEVFGVDTLDANRIAHDERIYA